MTFVLGERVSRYALKKEKMIEGFFLPDFPFQEAYGLQRCCLFRSSRGATRDFSLVYVGTHTHTLAIGHLASFIQLQ